MLKKIVLLDICLFIITMVINIVLSIFNPLQNTSLFIKYSYKVSLSLFCVSFLILLGCIIYALVKEAFND